MGWPALAYAALGFRVHPVWWTSQFGTCQCAERQNCLNPGKHPVLSGWPEAASADPHAVARMWRDAGPPANVGVATGRGSDLVVIDLDVSETCELVTEGGGGEWVTTRHDGKASFRSYVDERGIDVPRGPYYDTPGDGVQLWFRPHPGWTGKLPSLSGWLPGVDTRGDGGQVVVPPSGRYVDGTRRAYTWHGCPCALPTLPMALHEAIAADGGGRGWSGSRGDGSGGGGQRVELVRRDNGLIDVEHYRAYGVPLGVQNSTLVRLAAELLALGNDAGYVVETLWSIVCVSPFDPRRPRWERRHLARESSWEPRGIVDRRVDWLKTEDGARYAAGVNECAARDVAELRRIMNDWAGVPVDE